MSRIISFRLSPCSPTKAASLPTRSRGGASRQSLPTGRQKSSITPSILRLGLDPLVASREAISSSPVYPPFLAALSLQRRRSTSPLRPHPRRADQASSRGAGRALAGADRAHDHAA